MHITFVKKILLDGSLCKKCRTVNEQLVADGLTDQIDQVALADQADIQSPGMLLARQYNVQQAPFFVVQEDNGSIEIYDSYGAFRKFICQAKALPELTQEAS